MKWKWVVRCTYNDTVVWPKIPGEVAIETVHSDDVSKDIEVLASKARGDVAVRVLQYVSITPRNHSPREVQTIIDKIVSFGPSLAQIRFFPDDAT